MAVQVACRAPDDGLVASPRSMLMDVTAHHELEKRLHRLIQTFQAATLRAAGETAPLPLLAQEQMSRLRRELVAALINEVHAASGTHHHDPMQ